MKKKIVRLISRLNVGGPAQQAIYLTDRFNDDCWQAILMSGMEEAHESSMLYLASRLNVQVHRQKWMRRSVFLFRDLVALWQMYRFLIKTKPDILHTHTAKAGGIGRLAGFLARVPVIVHTFHGHVFHGYFNKITTQIYIFTERFLSRFTDCIITLTPQLQKDLETLGLRGRKGIEIVPLGLELKRFFHCTREDGILRKEIGLNGQDLLIGIVGRLVPIKRHEDILHAIQLLHERGVPAHLAIIGGGEREGELREWAQKLGLNSFVHFMGFRENLEHLYPDMDLVSLCSANEGMPVSLIEAMVSGIPIVATEVGGVSDLLSECPSCRIVPSFQRDRLAEALGQVLKDRANFAEKAQSYRKVAYERYRIENLVMGLDRLYRELLEEKV